MLEGIIRIKVGSKERALESLEEARPCVGNRHSGRKEKLNMERFR